MSDIPTYHRGKRNFGTGYDMMEYIKELETNLEKAMVALGKVQTFVKDLEPYADQGHTLVPALHDACLTYNELKGKKNV